MRKVSEMCDSPAEDMEDPLQGSVETDPESGSETFAGKILCKPNGIILVAHEGVHLSGNEVITEEEKPSMNKNNNNSTGIRDEEADENNGSQKPTKAQTHLIYYEKANVGIKPTRHVFYVHALDGNPDHTKELIKLVSSEENSESTKDSFGSSPFLMCFKCRVLFRAVTSFIIHVTNDHCVVTDDCELELLESKNTNAVLQEDENGRLGIYFLQPVGSEATVEESAVEAVLLNSTPVEESHSSGDITREKAKMSFAVASPLGTVHAQSPTSHQLLLNNVISGEPTLSQEVTTSPMDVAEAVDFPPQVKSPDDAAKTQPRVDSSAPMSLHTSQSLTATKEDMTSSSSRGSPLDETNTSHAIAVPLGTSQQSNIDTLLGGVSNADSIYPISLFQTRNSCKTLKCPKCNWHYKYRQTLEAHMKEKHFEETSDCVYCNASQPHPRLSRGESYSCGYKPFKCNVCNYSTTTKGNLSIHMQSDKHLYNARSLQQRQQDRIRQGVTTSSTFHVPRQPTSEGITAQNENVHQASLKRSSSPGNTSKFPAFSEAPMEKQLQSRRRRSSSKTSSSVDSGIFSVPSKTGSPTLGRRESSSGSGGKWRCDVCCYETGISRNLRIHLTSEKHAQNLALRERGLLNNSRNENDINKETNSSEAPQLPGAGGNLQGLMEYYAAAFKSSQQNGEGGGTSNKSFSLPDDVEKARKAQAQYLQHQLYLAQQQQLLLAQQYQQIMMAAAASSLQQRMNSQSKEELPQLSQINSQQLMLQNSQNQLWKQLFPQVNTDLPSIQTSLEKETKANNSLFSCGLCGVYGTDDINCLEAHVRKPRHNDITDLTNNEWVTRTRNREREGYFCKLCAYSTPLKTNFNLHCKTEKHTSKLSLISHVREGGIATEWMIPHIIRGNMTQNVTCNACQFATHSFEKLKLHCATDQHQGVQTVCQYLQSMLNARVNQADKVDGTGTFRFNCLACTDFTTMHVVEMVRHMQTAEHQVELQKQDNPGMAKLQDVIAIEREDTPSLETADTHKDKDVHDKTPSGCDYCNYSTLDKDRLNLHIMTQHSGQPLATCPLCQEVVKSSVQLRIHLVEAHNLQMPPAESKNREEMSTSDRKNDVKTSDRGIDNVTQDEQKDEDLQDGNTLNSRALVIDEEADGRVQGDEWKNVLNSTVLKNSADVEKLSSKRQIMGKNRSLDPNSLIMQVLKGNSSSTTNTLVASGQSSLNFLSREESEFSRESAMKSKNESETNAVFLDQEPMDTVSRSCPDLVTSVNEQMENNTSANFFTSRSRTRERKTNRIRVRSCPLDEPSRSRTYRRLLSNYGLEQARHYVENRSPHNRNKAKSFKMEKKGQRWVSLTYDPDSDFQETSKQPPTENASAHPLSESNMLSANTSSEKHMDVDEEAEGSIRTCRHCGKEFTGLWVLKAHEEVAHGVCVSTGNIQSIARAYSEQFQEKLKSAVASETPDRNTSPQENFSSSLLQGIATSDPMNQFKASATDLEMLSAQGEPALSLTEHQLQMQQQAMLQSVLKAQALKQAGALESNNKHMNPGVEGIHPGGFVGDQNLLSANVASQLGIYSAFLQAQAMGANPYQILSNAAALQQLQHLAGTSVLGLPDPSNNRVAKPTFSNSLATANMPSTSIERKSPAEKLEQQNHVDGSPSMIPGHIHARTGSLDIPQKRPRTRITDDQLKILRANFDINNSPSEQQIDDMAQSTSLPPKVIKHWFRNTLFKERQRSKDSPYNFNIPPITSLDDTVKAQASNQEETARRESSSLPSMFNEGYNSSDIKDDFKSDDNNKFHQVEAIDENEDKALCLKNYESMQRFSPSPSTAEERTAQNLKTQSSNPQNRQHPVFTNPHTLIPSLPSRDLHSPSQEARDPESNHGRNVSPQSSLAHPPIPKQHFSHLANWQALTSYESSSNNDTLFYENASSSDSMGIPNMQGSACRRTPRTRFTDFQLQVLQDFFDRNAYPKDDDLDRLSQTLSLSTRVIVVWFQNARQKARKSYEQQQQQQQQHGNHGRYSPGGEHERSVSKFEERLSATSRGVEDLARKTLNEVSQTILNENKINVKTEISKEMIEAAQKDAHLLHVQQDAENLLSRVKNASPKVSMPCQQCEKTFFSVEQWQKHQQDHLRANMASVFGQYGLMYIQGLVGNQEDQNKEHSMDKNDLESSKMTVLKSERDTDFAHGSIEMQQENKKRVERPLDESNKVAAFQNGKVFSVDKSMVRSRLITPSMVGSGKRKLSTSPTLSQTSPSSSSPTTSQTGSMGSKCSFMDDKEHMGMQKDPKRLRTTITPEQLEYLYQQYLVDSSPSRKIIEQISEVVGLKKRVVQVWFQNTRARERKGQFRSSISRCVSGQMNQYKLCPFCRMVFRSKEQYDVHVLTRHGQGSEPRTVDGDLPPEKKAKYSGHLGIENHNSNNSVNKDSLSYKTVLPKANLPDDRAVNLSGHVIKQQPATTPESRTRDFSTDLPLTSTPGTQRSVDSERQEPAFTSGTTPATVDYSAIFASNPNHPASIQLQKKLAALYASASVSVTVTPTQDSTASSFGRDTSRTPDAQRTSPAASANDAALPRQPPATARPIHTGSPLNFSTHSISSPVKPEGSDDAAENIPCTSDTLHSPAAEFQSSNVKSPSEPEAEMFHQNRRQPMQMNNVDIDDASTPTKRHRTQMSSSQVMALKHCFKVYKTPSLPECEELGRGIGLQKRVVQVWFQNARAKDKKRKLHSKVGVETPDHQQLDQADTNERPTECNICFPVVHYPSPQSARAHVFSSLHLQRLMRTVESERRKEFLGFSSTSHSSPCSSSDGAENQVQDHFASDTLSDQQSPDGQAERLGADVAEGTAPTLNGRMSISLHDRFPTSLVENNAMKSESSNNLKTEPKFQTAEVSGPDPTDHLPSNPALLQHYHQAVQQLMMASQKGADVEGSAEQQALLQQAMQKSLYQILNRPQTSPTGSQ